MANAANLQIAGFLSYPQMNIKRTGGTLAADVQTFATTATAIFSDNVPNDRPVGNWLVLIDATIPSLPPLNQIVFNQIVEYVGRMCLVAFTQLNSGLITNAQATDLLNAWNAAFGT